MSYEYRTYQDGELQLDELTDTANGVRITVNRLGGEMISLARRTDDGNWEGYLYRDGQPQKPAEGWGNHATVMGYYLHRLWEEKSDYHGHLIQGGNHGFIRHFRFTQPLGNPGGSGELVYRVEPDRIPKEYYPYRVGLDLSYSLRDGKVVVGFRFWNEETHPCEVSFGVHPGIAVTSVEDARVLLPAGTYTRYMAPGNFLNGETIEIHHQGGPMPFEKEKLPDSYLIALDLLSNRVMRVEDPQSGRALDLDFEEVPFMTIWSDFSPMVCVEPCWGLPDSNPPTPFQQKIGIQVIDAGGELEASFSLSPGTIAG